MTETKIEPLGFLDLPAELRINIYRYVLSTPALILPTRIDRFLRTPATVPARLLTCCKTINSEARPVFFEVTEFALREPRDLLRLKAVAGRLATRITRLTFFDLSMINKTRIRELRAFKALRIVNLQTRHSSVYVLIDPKSISRKELEEMAIETVGSMHSSVIELVRQRPKLTCVFDVQAMQEGETPATAGHAMSTAMLRNGIRFVGKIEIALAEDAAALVAKFVTLLRVMPDGPMMKVDVPAKLQS